MNVRELREALDGLPEWYEVEVESDSGAVREVAITGYDGSPPFVVIR